MLKGKNVVVVKGEKGSAPVIQEYDRVYLEFGSTDPLEPYEKTTEGKKLEVEGKTWSGSRPKENVSAVDPSVLANEALEYFAKTYPTRKENDKDVPNDPWLVLLEAASYGNDLWVRNKIQADIRPSKPMDESTALAKMVKIIKAMKPGISDEKATLLAKSMIEDEPVAA